MHCHGQDCCRSDLRWVASLLEDGIPTGLGSRIVAAGDEAGGGGPGLHAKSCKSGVMRLGFAKMDAQVQGQMLLRDDAYKRKEVCTVRARNGGARSIEGPAEVRILDGTQCPTVCSKSMRDWGQGIPSRGSSGTN